MSFPHGAASVQTREVSTVRTNAVIVKNMFACACTLALGSRTIIVAHSSSSSSSSFTGNSTSHAEQYFR